MSVEQKSSVERKLTAHGVKATPQRIEIGRLLLVKPCHMSAEQILSQLNASGVNISKATVYNTLNLFSRRGIVREVAVDPNHLVYDSTVSFHHHFYNVDTGELIDIDVQGLHIGGLPELPAGTTADRIELIVHVRNKA